MNITRVLFAAAVAVALPSSVTAQTDNPSSGSGSALMGSVMTVGYPGSGFAGFAGLTQSFLGATGGVSVPDPASGGMVTVSGAVARAIGFLLTGTPCAEHCAIAREAFGGTSAAGLLVDALIALGADQNPTTVAAAIQAYNAAVQALSAGQTPGPGLLAVRSVLSGFVQ